MAEAGFVFPTVVPALRNIGDWSEGFLKKDPQIVFVLGGSINTIAKPISMMERRGWKVFVHVDMLKGLSTDAEGLRFLSEYVGPTGIISTHASTIQSAKKQKLMTVQRLFLVDSQSLATGINQVQTSRPDAVELMPGLVIDAIRHMVRQLTCPVIAGGLITSINQVEEALKAGAVSVSTSSRTLWVR